MNANFLNIIRRMGKLYDKIMVPVREKHSLNQFEIDVLGFLHNNRDMDTASDIVKYRMIPKANVSQAVENLMKKDMLESIRDERDRRRVHLKINKSADTVIKDILNAQEEFTNIIFSGFTDEEREVFKNCSHRISENIINFIRKDD